MAPRARRARLALPVERAGPAHIATLKTFDPPLSRSRGGGSRAPAPREAPALPDRGRRARPARPPDERRAAALPAAGSEGAEDTDVPARVRRRRRAGADRGRQEEARGRLAAHARRGGGGARAPRAGGARARAGAARRDPARERRRLHALLRDQRAIAGHRPRAGERDPLAREALAVRAVDRALDEEVARLAAAIDEELSRGLALREAGKKDAAVYRINRLGEPCPLGHDTMPASTSRSTRSTTARRARRAAGC